MWRFHIFAGCLNNGGKFAWNGSEISVNKWIDELRWSTCQGWAFWDLKKKSPLQNIDQSKQGFPRGVLAKILEEPSHHVWRRSMVRTRKPKGWYMVIPSPVLKHLKLQWKHAFAESCFLRSAVANSELGTLCEKGVGTSHYWLDNITSDPTVGSLIWATFLGPLGSLYNLSQTPLQSYSNHF